MGWQRKVRWIFLKTKLLLPESYMDAKELLKGEAPPQLQITSGSIAFSGSGDIAANEGYFIEFEISNVAGGKSLGLEARVALEGASSRNHRSRKIEIPTLKPETHRWSPSLSKQTEAPRVEW